METESGKMFGLLAIKVDNQNSSNVASWALFDSLEKDDLEGFEENFPVDGFKVVSTESPENLKISDFGNLEWEGDELLFECQATWKIGVNPEDYEAWGAAFESLWGNSSIELEHANHPGLTFIGYFPSAPEYS